MLLEPKIQSNVAGVTVSTAIVSENIAPAHQEHRLVSEYLRVVINHDGTNPFIDTEKCHWGVVYAMSATDAVVTLLPDDEAEPEFELFCLPLGINVTEVVVTEGCHDEQTGLWLVCVTTGNEQDHAFCLLSYKIAG